MYTYALHHKLSQLHESIKLESQPLIFITNQILILLEADANKIATRTYANSVLVPERLKKVDNVSTVFKQSSAGLFDQHDYFPKVHRCFLVEIGRTDMANSSDSTQAAAIRRMDMEGWDANYFLSLRANCTIPFIPVKAEVLLSTATEGTLDKRLATTTSPRSLASTSCAGPKSARNDTLV